MIVAACGPPWLLRGRDGTGWPCHTQGRREIRRNHSFQMPRSPMHDPLGPYIRYTYTGAFALRAGAFVLLAGGFAAGRLLRGGSGGIAHG